MDTYKQYISIFIIFQLIIITTIYPSYALAPAGAREAGRDISELTFTIIPKYDENYNFSTLLPLSYTMKAKQTVTGLMQESIISAENSTRRGKLLTGDYAIQALNKIIEQKNTVSLPLDVSKLSPIIIEFDFVAYDKSGSIKKLAVFLSSHKTITEENIDELEKRLDDVNNMNERTELSLRFIKHQPGYDLMDPLTTLLWQRKSLKNLHNMIQNSIIYPAGALHSLINKRIYERKMKKYDPELPTLSISEAAEWRRILCDLIVLKSNDAFKPIYSQNETIKNIYNEIYVLFYFDLLPLVEGKIRKWDINLHEQVFSARSSVINYYHIPKDTIKITFSQTEKPVIIKGELTLIRESLKILFQNSFMVAQERLEDMNKERAQQNLSPLTFKDKPIEIKISFNREDDGSISIQLIEISDNVGGISDPEMLEETKPGSGRQKITRLNISRRRKGTGFGLAYVWHAINLHGGTFWIENLEGKPGRGIRASIRIPFDNRYKQATAESLSSSDPEVLNSQ